MALCHVAAPGREKAGCLSPWTQVGVRRHWQTFFDKMWLRAVLAAWSFCCRVFWLGATALVLERFWERKQEPNGKNEQKNFPIVTMKKRAMTDALLCLWRVGRWIPPGPFFFSKKKKPSCDFLILLFCCYRRRLFVVVGFAPGTRTTTNDKQQLALLPRDDIPTSLPSFTLDYLTKPNMAVLAKSNAISFHDASRASHSTVKNDKDRLVNVLVHWNQGKVRRLM